MSIILVKDILDSCYIVNLFEVILNGFLNGSFYSYILAILMNFFLFFSRAFSTFYHL